jgi:hypothetical protein
MPAEKWKSHSLSEGDQTNPASNRGCSEVKAGKLKSGGPIIATIEPWHGDKVVAYTQAEARPTGSDRSSTTNSAGATPCGAPTSMATAATRSSSA